MTRDAARYDARKAREKLLSAEGFDPSRVRRYALRPLDHMWCYFTPVRPIWNEPRPSLSAQCWEGNAFVLSRFNRAKDPEGVPFYFARGLSDDHILAPDAAATPLRLRQTARARVASIPGLESPEDLPVPNLSAPARAYITSLGLQDPHTSQEAAEVVWYHALAVGYSPAYLSENDDGISQDWPRIPLPAGMGVLAASAALGRQVAALLDVETPVEGVTVGTIRKEYRGIGIFQRIDGKPARPDAGDLDVTAGWGHAGKAGATMPGKGKLVKRDDGARDVFLNDVTCWRNVPVAVWDYTIGGYQVIKKWLSYREKPLLGRALTPDEVRHVTDMACRLAALVALQPALDDNYRAIIRNTYSWPKQ